MWNSLDYAGLAQLCARSPIMRKIMRAHNRIIQPSLTWTILEQIAVVYQLASFPVIQAWVATLQSPFIQDVESPWIQTRTLKVSEFDVKVFETPWVSVLCNHRYHDVITLQSVLPALTTVISTPTVHTPFVDSTPADCSSLQNSGRRSSILICHTWSMEQSSERN